MNSADTFGIWCVVSGGVTGHREAWLKDDAGVVKRFNRHGAQAEASRLNATVGRNSSARFNYSVCELPYGGGQSE